MSTEDSQLSKLTTPASYQGSRSHVFPSQASLDWFARRNRARLVKAGTLVQLAGRNLIHAERFDSEAMAIGQEAMAAEAA